MQTKHQVTPNPQTKTNDWSCEFVSRLLPSTYTTTIYYYYSARKLMLILLSYGGRRLSRPRQCRKCVQPLSKSVYCSVCRDKHNCGWRGSMLGSLTPKSGKPGSSHTVVRQISTRSLQPTHSTKTFKMDYIGETSLKQAI